MTILTFNPFEREPSWITRLTYNRALRCFEFIPRRISTTPAWRVRLCSETTAVCGRWRRGGISAPPRFPTFILATPWCRG
jgi:hypothetical protein